MLHIQQVGFAYMVALGIALLIAPTASVRMTIDAEMLMEVDAEDDAMSLTRGCADGTYYDMDEWENTDQKVENAGRYMDSSKDGHCYDVCQAVEGSGGNLALFFDTEVERAAAKVIVDTFCPQDAIVMQDPRTLLILVTVKLVTQLHDLGSRTTAYEVMEALLPEHSLGEILKEYAIMMVERADLVRDIGPTKIMFNHGTNNYMVASCANVLAMPLLAGVLGNFGKKVQDDMIALSSRKAPVAEYALTMTFDFGCSVGTANVLLQQVESLLGMEIATPTPEEVFQLIRDVDLMAQSSKDKISHKDAHLLEQRTGMLPVGLPECQNSFNDIHGMEPVLREATLYQAGLNHMVISQSPFTDMIAAIVRRE